MKATNLVIRKYTKAWTLLIPYTPIDQDTVGSN